MLSECSPTGLPTEPKIPADVLARVLARGTDEAPPHRQLAGDLLRHFGSLEALAGAGTDSLLTVPSLSAEDIALVRAIGDLVDMIRTSESGGSGPVVDSFERLSDYLWPLARRLAVGVELRVIMLDHTHRVVGDVDLRADLGPWATASAIVSKVLQHCAAGIVLVRVQASARTDVSEEFGQTVRQVRQALDRLDVRLLDVALATPAGVVRLDGSAWPGQECNGRRFVGVAPTR